MLLDVKISEDGEHYIEFPDELMDKLGWKIGDSIKWTDNKDGTWSIEKMEEKYFVVDVLSTFRCRYIVKAKKESDALDEVAMKVDDTDLVEFSQKHLGTQIVDSRQVSREDILSLHLVDNDYLKGWTEEQIFNGLTNSINYEE